MVGAGLEELFAMAGDLKAELKAIVRDLGDPMMVYRQVRRAESQIGR